MRNHYWDFSVQFYNWCGFSATLSENEANLRAFVEGPKAPIQGRTSGVDICIQTMRDHNVTAPGGDPLDQSYRVREEIMQVTRSLMQHSDEYRAALVEAGLVGEVVRAMRELHWDSHVQSVGTMNLAATLRGSAAMQAAIAGAGAIPLLLASLRTHNLQKSSMYGGASSADLWPVLTTINNLLGLLAFNHTANQAELRDAGGPGIVWEVMRSNPLDTGVGFTGCFALEAMTRSRAEVAEATGGEAVCEGSWMETWSEDVKAHTGLKHFLDSAAQCAGE